MKRVYAATKIREMAETAQKLEASLKLSVQEPIGYQGKRGYVVNLRGGFHDIGAGAHAGKWLEGLIAGLSVGRARLERAKKAHEHELVQATLKAQQPEPGILKVRKDFTEEQALAHLKKSPSTIRATILFVEAAGGTYRQDRRRFAQWVCWLGNHKYLTGQHAQDAMRILSKRYRDYL